MFFFSSQKEVDPARHVFLKGCNFIKYSNFIIHLHKSLLCFICIMVWCVY